MLNFHILPFFLFRIVRNSNPLPLHGPSLLPSPCWLLLACSGHLWVYLFSLYSLTYCIFQIPPISEIIKYLSLSDLFHLAQCLPSLSVLLKMASCCYFFSQLSNIPLCMYHVPLKQSPADGHSGSFHVLAIVNRPATNTSCMCLS